MKSAPRLVALATPRALSTLWDIARLAAGLEEGRMWKIVGSSLVAAVIVAVGIAALFHDPLRAEITLSGMQLRLLVRRLLVHGCLPQEF